MGISEALHRLIEEGFNQGNLAVVDQLVSPSFGMAIKEKIMILRKGLPDLSCILLDQLHTIEKSAAVFSLQGTHTGYFLGNRPTHREVKVAGMLIAHVRESHVISGMMLIDQFQLLQQLGLLPPTNLLSTGKEFL